MKKLALTFLLVPALTGLALAQKVPTADEVINKYINAIGGKKALMNVKDMTWQFSWPGTTMTYKQKAPAKSVYIVTSDKDQFVYKNVIDGINVVEVTPQGTTRRSGLEAKRSIIEHKLFPELSYKEDGVKSTVEGKEQIDGRDAYKVTSTFADGSPLWTNYYDLATGLKVQYSITGQDGTKQTIKYTDYKDVDGLKIPFGLTSQSTNWLTQAKVNSVQINKGVSDTEFNVQ